MTPGTPEHRDMPLTLAFVPDNMDEEKPIFDAEGQQRHGVVIAQPSAEESGRIFVACNPYGLPVGVHLIPEEAARLRDHLNTLLLEPGNEDSPQTPEEIEEQRAKLQEALRASPVPDEGVDWKERIAAAAQRAAAETPEQRLTRDTSRRRRWFQFRLEFMVGRLQGLIARTDDT